MQHGWSVAALVALVCSGLVVGAVLIGLGGTLIGLAMLELTERRRLFLIADGQEAVGPPQADWGQVSVGMGMLGVGLGLMVVTQRSVFARTLVKREKVMLRLRFVERRRGVRKKKITFPGARANSIF